MKIRAGSLISFAPDGFELGDVGIVLELIDEEPNRCGSQEIRIWWCCDGQIEYFLFEPFGSTETVLRY